MLIGSHLQWFIREQEGLQDKNDKVVDNKLDTLADLGATLINSKKYGFGGITAIPIHEVIVFQNFLGAEITGENGASINIRLGLNATTFLLRNRIFRTGPYDSNMDFILEILISRLNIQDEPIQDMLDERGINYLKRKYEQSNQLALQFMS
jgi:hypothetical protein